MFESSIVDLNPHWSGPLYPEFCLPGKRAGYGIDPGCRGYERGEYESQGSEGAI